MERIHPEKLKNDGLALRLVLIYVVSLCGIITSVFSFCAYGGIGCHPAESRLLSICGVCASFLFWLNLLFIGWCIYRKRYLSFTFALNLIAVILLGTQLLNFSKSVAAATPSLKVLSYNVRGFNYFVEESSSLASIAQHIQETNADIICLQEYMEFDNYERSNLKQYLKNYPYFIQSSEIVKPEIHEGIAVFSKFPIVKALNIPFEEMPNGAQLCHFVVRGDTLALLNVHLETTEVNQNGNALLHAEKDLSDVHFRRLLSRFFDSFYDNSLQRSAQVEKLDAILRKEPYPLIICGDFNDTDFSYTYHKLAHSMKDSFKERGIGFGTTYKNLFRIDHILYSPSFQVVRHQVMSWKDSDHKAVVSECFWK